MTWIVAIGLALAALALAAFAMRGSRAGLATIGAALALGLAGYALQASPDTPGAPAQPANRGTEANWSLVEARAEMIGPTMRSGSQKVLIADGFARRGRFGDAATILDSALDDNPRDYEAWLALGNALVEHAEGALTPPALLAYRRANAIDPTGVGPGYFLGLAMIRQGRFGDARGIWASTLAGTPAETAGRAALEERLGRLDALLAAGGRIPPPAQ